jgi:3-hydroxyacyl-[acyl-carrier-protein] dehydratase
MGASFLHGGVFFFDPGDGIYRDHFPGNPVVPGSVIIHAFLRAHARAGKPRPVGVANFRFKRFVSPGEYWYAMGEEGHGIRCTLFDNNRAVVTGTLVL